MVVYARTEEGQLAAYSPQSALPRKLKSILKVVDGKTPTHVFEQNLRSFGDVQGILRSLETAGLLRVMSSEVHSIHVKAEHSEADRGQSADARQIGDWMPTRNPLEQRSQLLSNMTGSYANSQLASVSNTWSSVTDQNKADALAAVLEAMSSFVLVHVPEQSFHILKEIEEITSLEILAATIGGYEQMVSHLGDVSTEHLRYLKATLRDNL